jgi:hypothetical protein
MLGCKKQGHVNFLPSVLLMMAEKVTAYSEQYLGSADLGVRH